MNEKEFDRSVCFTYFGNYYKQVTEIEKQFGMETAYKVERAIIEYGLFKKEIDDPTIRIFVGAPTLDLIDGSQTRRANGFGEDVAKTEAVLEYYREHPQASQNEIAKATGVSKGKVNKIMKELKSGGKSSDNVSGNNVVSVSDVDIDTDVDSMTVTGDRSTECHTEDAALKDADASAPLQIFEKAQKRDEVCTLTDYQKAVRENEDRLKKYEQEMKVYKESLAVIDLFEQYIKPRDIAKQTHFNIGFVNRVIDEYKDQNYHKPEEPRKQSRKLEVPTQTGKNYTLYLDELYIDPADIAYMYKEFTNPDGEYQFQPEFTADWFKDQYDYTP